MATPILNGTVKFFNSEKGFGFIKYDLGEIFFHKSMVLNAVSDNDEVEFQIGVNPKDKTKQQAINVKRI